MPIIKVEKATPAQVKYIEQLAIDLEFDRHRRNRHIEAIVLRPINWVDQLTKQEASKVITQFKEWKEEEKDYSSNYNEDENV